MAAHLNEEEQIEALKRWWKDNGKMTVAVLVIAGLGFFGWNQYQSHVEQRAVEGSEQYQQFLTAVERLEEGDSEAAQAEVEALGAAIIEEHKDTLYADFVRLYRAQRAVQDDNLVEARRILEEAKNSTRSESLSELINMRLARAIAAQGETDAALELLNDSPSNAYAAVYAEARGDILASRQRYSEARSAYESALQAMSDPVSMRRSLVQLKMDNTKTASDQTENPALREQDSGSDADSRPEAVAPEDA